ncbi:hypothetical protein MLD38_019060 [Melastoma candidum]|uniref:Uncharacterized protein n=1 Tax=Melastoma candidum TaxID=119954 RepID=A0ACB9QWD9_9MYRT|nr:hypothetical protein MLD38_019060 [Melastoma candidum]
MSSLATSSRNRWPMGRDDCELKVILFRPNFDRLIEKWGEQEGLFQSHITSYQKDLVAPKKKSSSDEAGTILQAMLKQLLPAS